MHARLPLHAIYDNVTHVYESVRLAQAISAPAATITELLEDRAARQVADTADFANDVVKPGTSSAESVRSPSTPKLPDRIRGQTRRERIPSPFPNTGADLDSQELGQVRLRAPGT